MNGGPYNTQLVAYEAWNARKTLDSLIQSKTPISTIGALIARSGSPDAEPFERYAGSVLQDAGAEQLLALPPGCSMRLDASDGIRVIRLACNSNGESAPPSSLTGLEDALNRLNAIVEAIEDSARPRSKPAFDAAISRMGSGFLSDRAGWRSAHIAMPAIGRAERPDMRYFNEVDWRILDHVAVIAHAVFQSSVLPNLHQSFMGIRSPDGSDWDVRTRLALILAKLDCPLRSDFRFDVNVMQQTVSIAFTIPPAEAFPARVYHRLAHAPATRGTHLDDARLAYTMRLSCLLAAAAFGAGRKIERAITTGIRLDDAQPVFTSTFERKHYVHHTLTAIDAGELSDPTIRFDVKEIARLMAPQHLEFVDFEGNGAIKRPDDGMQQLRIEPHLDSRMLTDTLREVFHSTLISDIDTQHYHGPGSQAITEARLDSNDSALAAIANLEHVVSELETKLAAPCDNADARPLYCANPLARAVVSLLDDDLSVADQAEAFLHGEEDPRVKSRRHPDYYRAPDALYHAHIGLSDLYERLGDITGSEAHANRCIALAPTSAQAYFRKADVLAQQSRFNEAANVLSEGLRFAASPRDCALLYYHLALILWNTGRKSEACAVHVYTSSLAGEYADKARKVVVNLRKHADSPVIVFASPLAATREMERARIPIAPSDAARTLIVKAAIGLTCANAPEASAPYAAALASYFPDDPVIFSTCQSLVEGSTFPQQTS